MRRALMAVVSDTIMYPTGSVFSDCQGVALPQLVAMASNRTMWRAKVSVSASYCIPQCVRLIAGVCTHYVVYNISKKKNTVVKSKIKER